MTEEDKKFFEDARDLFLTTGWANFKAELEVAINQIHVANCEDEKAFWMAKGRFEILSKAKGSGQPASWVVKWSKKPSLRPVSCRLI